jgi:hypothetical protein
MLGGAPEAHEVLSKTPRINLLSTRNVLPEAFPIKASDFPVLVRTMPNLITREAPTTQESRSSASSQVNIASIQVQVAQSARWQEISRAATGALAHSSAGRFETTLSCSQL